MCVVATEYIIHVAMKAIAVCVIQIKGSTFLDRLIVNNIYIKIHNMFIQKNASLIPDYKNPFISVSVKQSNSSHNKGYGHAYYNFICRYE